MYKIVIKINILAGLTAFFGKIKSQYGIDMASDVHGTETEAFLPLDITSRPYAPSRVESLKVKVNKLAQERSAA